MTDRKEKSGLDYALKILCDEWQPTLIFWLGFRPLLKDELTQLVPELSAEQLDIELTALQNLRIVNPVKDTENKYSLTDDGEDLRQQIVSLSVWGKHQLNADEDKISVGIVEPELDAQVSELVKFRQLVKEYIN